MLMRSVTIIKTHPDSVFSSEKSLKSEVVCCHPTGIVASLAALLTSVMMITMMMMLID